MNADDELAIALAMDCKRRRERLKAHGDDLRAELPRTFTAARKEPEQLLRRLWQIIERVARL